MPRLFGDAYDAAEKACTIGGIVFDFSLKLGRGDFTRHILYGDCKYRNEHQGNVNQDFSNFLKRVHDALRGAEVDEADNTLFSFPSNIPPDDWRGYRKRSAKILQASDRLGVGISPRIDSRLDRSESPRADSRREIIART